jgi:hypothetical protein
MVGDDATPPRTRQPATWLEQLACEVKEARGRLAGCVGGLSKDALLLRLSGLHTVRLAYSTVTRPQRRLSAIVCGQRPHAAATGHACAAAAHGLWGGENASSVSPEGETGMIGTSSKGQSKHDVGIWSSLRPRACLITSPVSHSSHPEAPSEVMAPDLRTIDEIRRRVISDLVDLEIVSARRLSARQRILLRLRRTIGARR